MIPGGLEEGEGLDGLELTFWTLLSSSGFAAGAYLTTLADTGITGQKAKIPKRGFVSLFDFDQSPGDGQNDSVQLADVTSAASSYDRVVFGNLGSFKGPVQFGQSGKIMIEVLIR